MPQPAQLEDLSPELVLVDPGFAVSARDELSDPDDTLARLERLRRAERYAAPARSTISVSVPEQDDAAAAALQRITEASLAAEPRPSRTTMRPRRTLSALLIATAATSAAALFMLDARTTPSTESRAPETLLGTGSLPTTENRTRPAKRTAKTPAAERRNRPTAQAAGRANDTRAKPKAKPRTAAVPASSPRRLVWRPVPGASAYRVELFRGSSRVFGADTRRLRMTIPAFVSAEGRRQRLRAGEYRGYVWAAVAGAWSDEPILQTTLVLPART